MSNFFVNQIFDANLLIAMAIASLAGLISFFSPCVIPLVPGYLAYASGMGDSRNRSRVLLGSILFVSGFTALFISYGLLFGQLGSKIAQNSRTISVVLGLLTMALGVIFLFNEKFYRSFKPSWKMRTGLISAPFIGFAFGIGWTPCIGPILGSILAFASMEDSIYKGILLLSLYSLGLAVPFVLSGLLIKRFLIFSKSAKNYLINIKKVSGIILIITGILIVTGKLQILGFYLIEYFPILQKLG